MSAIFAVAGKLVTLFIYVLVGYVVSKRKMISEGFSAGISRFLLVVTIPCLVLSTFETDYTFERLVKAGEVYVPQFDHIWSEYSDRVSDSLDFQDFLKSQKASGFIQ